jgi:LEA14-like dessication related protein
LKHFAPILCFLALFCACKKPQSPEFRAIQNVKLAKAGFDQSIITLDINMYNPNNFGVSLKKVDCDILMNQIYVSKFLLDTLLYIPAKSVFIIPGKLDIDTRKMLSSGVTLFFNKDVVINANGSCKAGRNGIYLTIPVKYETSLHVTF